ncbi:hypothetical protein, conserved [Eimeria tenella]|uniref:C2H2-type domain-containing protein n=1 Tax=Eimeria tenella TaxID=5802 RepID=U6KKA5_EIMTE|nr:hypothetical protein, conserved [Eimeria tenella]CDJ37261.1 hypothetical protein, conserved [Eimeria tenella]|eukprot:XP_013228099.1 hypothetical protein, conserved [Eimeria tenella]
MVAPPLDGMGPVRGPGEESLCEAASESEDPVAMLSLPPPSSLCRFVSLQQHRAAAAGLSGTGSKQSAAAAAAAGRSNSTAQEPLALNFDPSTSAPLSKLSVSLLPDFLRRHFQRETQLSTDRRQPNSQAAPAAAYDCIRHPTYAARVSELAPLAIVLLISLVARLRQRQQQQQQQQVIGNCLIYAQLLLAPPSPSLSQQMHAGKPFLCFCCSRRFSTSAAKLQHLERHMRRRLQQQQQSGGGRHSLASSRTASAAAAAAAAQHSWPGVSSWIAAASRSSFETDSAAAASADAEAAPAGPEDTPSALEQQMNAAVHALSSLGMAEMRQHEAQGALQAFQEGTLEGTQSTQSGQIRFPSWLPPVVAAQLALHAMQTDTAAASSASQSGSTASASSQAVRETSRGDSGLAVPGAAATAAAAAAAAASNEQQQQQTHVENLASVATEVAQQLQQHETKLWQWCFSAADVSCSKTEPLGSLPGAFCGSGIPPGGAEIPEESMKRKRAVAAATPQQWTVALLQLAAAIPTEKAAAAAVAALGSQVADSAAAEESERVLLALRQCSAAAAAAAEAAAAVSPSRVILQEAERLRRCFLCSCSLGLSLDEQQQQYYLRDAVAVALKQQQQQQHLADAIVAAVAPALWAATASAGNSNSGSSSDNSTGENSSCNMSVENKAEQSEELSLGGLTAAAVAMSTTPLLQLVEVNPADNFCDSNNRQQHQQQKDKQQQQQQPKYLQVSSCIGAQPSVLSVALEVEAAALQQQSEGGCPAAATAAAAAEGRAASAVDAAAAEAAYKSLVSMEMTDGELEPLQKEILSLLRQQLPAPKQQQQRTVATDPDASNATAATAACSELTLKRVLPPDLVYLHRECYMQHLQQQRSLFQLLLLLLLLRLSGAQENKEALQAMGRLLVQLLQQHESTSKSESRKPQEGPSLTGHNEQLGASSLSLGKPLPIARKIRRRF